MTTNEENNENTENNQNDNENENTQENNDNTNNQTDNKENNTDENKNNNEYKAVEEYEDFNTAENVEYNQDIMAEFKDSIKGKLSQEDAQKLVDIATKNNEMQQQAMQSQFDSWSEEINNDPEFGGDKLQETLFLANRTVEEFSGEDGLKLFKENPMYGNNPTLIKMLAKMSKAHPKEDSTVSGNPAGKDKSAEEVMYG
jgi:hypothetical protein